MTSPQTKVGTISGSTVMPSATNVEDADLPNIPHLSGEFAILRKLGEGSYGQVYLASQLSLGRLVALKITTGQQGGRNEGQLLAGLEHDHIVKVFSEFADPATDTHSLCLQYIPGTNLGTLIKHLHAGATPPRCGRAILAVLDAHAHGDVGFDPVALRDRDALAAETFPQAVCRLGARLAEALAFAHGKGILHCDIKPANILLTPYGRPLLADFNVAFDRSRHQACDGFGGTLAYTAPEHTAALHNLPGGFVDERSDVFSLGMVLHELAAGSRPVVPRGETGKPGGDGNVPSMDSCDSAKRDSLEALPRELAVVIRRCLQYDANARYQSAADLAAALRGAWDLLAVRRRLPPPGRTGRLVAAYPIAALVLAGTVPHLAASAANIGYNAAQIRLSPAQQSMFGLLIFFYNLTAYPVLLGVATVYLWKLRRQLRTLPWGGDIIATRRRARNWGWWIVVVGAVGWFPGALLFPLAIDLATGPIPAHVYVHFLISFALAGLIGVVFSFLGTQYVLVRGLLPRLCDPDRDRPGQIGREFAPFTRLYGAFLILACAVPLAGAVLLVVLAGERLPLSFRFLVVGLIGLGVAGVAVAERVVRTLRAHTVVWEQEETTPS